LREVLTSYEAGFGENGDSGDDRCVSLDSFVVEGKITTSDVRKMSSK